MRIVMMDQQQPYLIALLAALMAVPLVFAFMRSREKKHRAQWHDLERGRRKRNIAEYRTWQWLYGKPKARRITDQRAGKERGAKTGL